MHLSHLELKISSVIWFTTLDELDLYYFLVTTRQLVPTSLVQQSSVKPSQHLFRSSVFFIHAPLILKLLVYYEAEAILWLGNKPENSVLNCAASVCEMASKGSLEWISPKHLVAFA